MKRNDEGDVSYFDVKLILIRRCGMGKVNSFSFQKKDFSWYSK